MFGRSFWYFVRVNLVKDSAKHSTKLMIRLVKWIGTYCHLTYRKCCRQLYWTRNKLLLLNSLETIHAIENNLKRLVWPTIYYEQSVNQYYWIYHRCPVRDINTLWWFIKCTIKVRGPWQYFWIVRFKGMKCDFGHKRIDIDIWEMERSEFELMQLHYETDH